MDAVGGVVAVVSGLGMIDGTELGTVGAVLSGLGLNPGAMVGGADGDAEFGCAAQATATQSASAMTANVANDRIA